MPERRLRKSNDLRGEVLVAVMNNARDWGIVLQHQWYRIPVAKSPRRWPPQWLAFYHTKEFGDLAHSVRYYARVRDIRIVPRRQLLPDEMPNSKSSFLYYQLLLGPLQELPRPIPSARGRLIVFIPTTLPKLLVANEINDLYDESSLEDRLWSELKKHELSAERQLYLKLRKKWYALDFALYCRQGKLNVETDGDCWHATPEQAAQDYPRDNEVQAAGWRVLRFNSWQIREQAATYCLPKVTELINQLGGPEDEHLVARRFHSLDEGLAEQPSLLEDEAEYNAGDESGD
ncbi:MAG TPA: DUF559 domain-containing protein [Anaerolineae bacterium]|nr:DUF559 domain-containing protein [Anaerolineae bacterium]HQJ51316.1 DUF559 domain-containing protein [Anaerolineae bacterium]